MMTSPNTESTEDRELVTNRVLDAPRELVWRAWTEPQHIAHWWGPNGFTNTIQEMNVQVGGMWRLTMHGPDGKDWPNLITYIEVVKPERLVYFHGSDEDPQMFQVTMTLTAQGDKTAMSFVMRFRSVAEKEEILKGAGVKEGNKQTFDRLAAHLAGMV